MTGSVAAARRRFVPVGCALMLTLTSCAFHGLNSLPLPGAIGRGPGAATYHVEIANVATLESNSPVMIDDVVVGSIGKMKIINRHADIEISVKPATIIPANAVATIGQTSLLGSMHLSLDPPLGQAPRGKLALRATLPLNQSSTYPTTEGTLSSLAAVVNGGGLGRIGEIIHNSNIALSGHESEVRDVLKRLDHFVSVLDRQRDNVIATITALNQLGATFASQTPVLDRALHNLPAALDVLISERPRLTAALHKLGQFANTTTRLINDSQTDLIKNLANLEPVVRALADIGPDLDRAIAAATVYPFTQNVLDRAFRGDYMNLFVIIDLTLPRLKRTLLLGTRWGQEGAKLVPAPGEPWYLNYTYQPLAAPVALPPPTATGPGSAGAAPPPGGAPIADPPLGTSQGAQSGGSPAPGTPGAAPEIAPWDTGGR